MHRANHQSESVSPRLRPRLLRAAFTLIELLMVIAIISLLLALLVPAVFSAFLKAKNAQVKSEIEGLANACDSFKGKYGVYPPSRITLYETAAGWFPPGMPTDAVVIEAARSRALIRRIWPDFVFRINRRINGDTDMTDTLVLNGGECLVFFLGGMPQRDATNGLYTTLGFSSNSQNPFSRTGSSRLSDFKFEDSSRLDDDNGNGMPDYHDVFNIDSGKPYTYISTNNASNAYIPGHLVSTGMKSHYYQKSINDLPPGLPWRNASPSGPAWRPGGFQIISPGMDQEYGIGGAFTADDASRLLVVFPLPAATYDRRPEKDNITNFHSGRLSP